MSYSQYPTDPLDQSVVENAVRRNNTFFRDSVLESSMQSLINQADVRSNR